MNDAQNAKKASVASYFGQVAPGYDQVGPQFFAQMGRRLVELAQIPPGARVLDVATGRGALLFPAAEQVGPAGQVVGIDVAEGMIRETSAEVQRRALTNVQLEQMDAEHLAFPDASFDVVLCGFALFFFPQLQRALAEFRRILKPGGRRSGEQRDEGGGRSAGFPTGGGVLAVSTWGPPDPGWDWYDDFIKMYRVPQIALVTEPLEQPADLEAALRQAGFTALRVIPQVVEIVYRDEEEWWARQLAQGTRLLLEGISPETLARFKSDVLKRLRAHKQRDGIHRQTHINFALAARP